MVNASNGKQHPASRPFDYFFIVRVIVAGCEYRKEAKIVHGSIEAFSKLCMKKVAQCSLHKSILAEVCRAAPESP